MIVIKINQFPIGMESTSGMSTFLFGPQEEREDEQSLTPAQSEIPDFDALQSPGTRNLKGRWMSGLDKILH